MPFKKYILVTDENEQLRIPKVLEDYIYSLHIFHDVIHFKELTPETYLQSDYIYVITNMWLTLNNAISKNLLYSQDRILFLNVEMLSESKRANYILKYIKHNIQICDYSLSNINIIQQYAKQNNVLIKKPIIYLPYQFNFKDKIQLSNLDKKYEYDVGIINALPKKSDTVDSNLTYRRETIWNLLQNTDLTSINIIGWDKNRDDLIKKCKVIINVHHFECFNIFEHIRCDRLIMSGIIVISDISYYMEQLDIYPYVYWCKFDKIIETTQNIINNYDKYHKQINDSELKNLIENREKILKENIQKIK